ncbi:hypothetical protein DAPPUDRAFT_334649 [Daphnia pulex]|uniref:Endonuclease/exonuclease/phosphatase domain-containing protein n=1 Tax=Daphnia pulex TaxID=6669 RepID=E9HW33_DAPPU|nr:hypothetical protein DAPPUDRAFT_334649 [Daphnia pulex]|eukprot:EFX64047.1 hypothetical protein DAPPUDRAFT_334649 [Daphnia pulex]
MKIATINIARISSEERLILLLNYCLTQKFDVVGLQEVAFASCPILENHFQLFAAPGPNKAGTAILVAKHLAVQYPPKKSEWIFFQKAPYPYCGELRWAFNPN